MREYVVNFLNDFDYPEEAKKELIEAYDALVADEFCKSELDRLVNLYEENINLDYGVIFKSTPEMEKKCGVHHYKSELIVFILFSKHLKKLYNENNIDESIWFNSMLDLKYKLIECNLVKGIYGSFVASWFDRFFNMTRFALGRLQFEISSFKYEYQKNGKRLTPDSPVINVHIPRTETPLDRQSCLTAYAMAKDFFKDDFTKTPMAFVCWSWLLFDRLRDFLPETANIILFMNDYDVIKTAFADEGDYTSLWRIFDMECPDNLEALPEDTTLRRAYKAYAKNGGRLGTGYGVFFA